MRNPGITLTSLTDDKFGNLLDDAEAANGGNSIDNDPHSVNAVAPEIDVEKLVSVDGGATYFDADDPTGPSLIESGAAPIFKFVVTNTGDVSLENIILSDTDFDLNGDDPSTDILITSLDPNGTRSYALTNHAKYVPPEIDKEIAIN